MSAPDVLGQPGRPVEVHGQVARVKAHLARRAAHADHACVQMHLYWQNLWSVVHTKGTSCSIMPACSANIGIPCEASRAHKRHHAAQPAIACAHNQEAVSACAAWPRPAACEIKEHSHCIKQPATSNNGVQWKIQHRHSIRRVARLRAPGRPHVVSGAPRVRKMRSILPGRTCRGCVRYPTFYPWSPKWHWLLRET